MIPGTPENKRLTPAYENKAMPSISTRSIAIHHYTPIMKLGYPRGVRCWCGAELVFSYHEPGMKDKRKAFFEQHTDCVPSSETAILASGTK